MLLALHYEALVQAIMSPDNQNGIFSRSKIALTKSILEDYHSKIATDPEAANYFFPFFQAISNRLKILPPSNIPASLALTEDYIYSAKYGGKHLALADHANLSIPDVKKCDLNGVRIIKVKDLFSDDGKLGYEPFEKHQLSHGVKSSPSIIEHFFRNETRVLFYDKFINNDAISLINFLLEKTNPRCSVTIVTSKKAACDIETIRKKVKKVGSRKIRVELANKATSERIHDRFIYIDNHYELHIPRGLDVFGSSPDWVNCNALISVYDVYKCGVEIQLGFDSLGSYRPRPIAIRSLVNS